MSARWRRIGIGSYAFLMGSQLFDLAGRVAIVTGASRGIGEAIAMRLAEAGATVVAAARKPEGLEAVVAKIKASGGKAIAVVANTGKPEDIDRLVQTAIKDAGKIDILVNNAAANPYFGPLLGTESAAWDKTFDVNVKGYFLLARGVINHLQERGVPGSIVNVTSIMGLRAAALQGVYGMTKAAVISMTQTFAQELGPLGIRVNAIAPGLVDTKFASAIVSNDDLRKHVVAKSALGRHAQPDEIAGTALYLASDASSYVTGQVIVVDGGTTITT